MDSRKSEASIPKLHESLWALAPCGPKVAVASAEGGHALGVAGGEVGEALLAVLSGIFSKRGLRGLGFLDLCGFRLFGFLTVLCRLALWFYQESGSRVLRGLLKSAGDGC